MSARKKCTVAEKSSAVRRYMAKEASVNQIAKENGVSEPAIYQWIAQARERASIDARTQELGPAALEMDARISKDLLIESLKQQVMDLKNKLFELWLQKAV